MTPEDTQGALDDLITVCRDGEEGFRAAATEVKNSELETLFLDLAKKRAHFVKELQNEVIRLGGTPAESGTVGGALHRVWMDVKSALTGGSAAAIVAACETGEDAAAAHFERVVNTDITGQTRALVEKQWKQIVETHRHLIKLKEEAKSGLEFQDTES